MCHMHDSTFSIAYSAFSHFAFHIRKYIYSQYLLILVTAIGASLPQWYVRDGHAGRRLDFETGKLDLNYEILIDRKQWQPALVLACCSIGLIFVLLILSSISIS